MKYQLAPKVNYWIYPALALPTEFDNKIELFMQCFYKASNTNEYLVKNKSRKQEYVIHRHLAMYLIFNQFNTSYAYVGKYFSKDHATVMHAVKMVKNALETDKRYPEYFSKVVTYMNENYLGFKRNRLYS